MGLMRRVGVEPEVTFTGGVSRNVGVVKELNDALGFAVNVSDDSHFMGALGAALFALDHILASREPAAQREHAMTLTAGIDVGSTYTKAVVLGAGRRRRAQPASRPASRWPRRRRRAFDAALADAGVRETRRRLRRQHRLRALPGRRSARRTSPISRPPRAARATSSRARAPSSTSAARR